MCTVGSFGVAELTPGVELCAGVAGWVGAELEVEVAFAADSGGDLVAAGPASSGCVGDVVVAVGAVVAAVGGDRSAGRGCPGRWSLV